MMTVWSCYEAFKNIAYSLSWEDGLIEQACQQHPDWCVAGLSLPAHNCCGTCASLATKVGARCAFDNLSQIKSKIELAPR